MKRHGDAAKRIREHVSRFFFSLILLTTLSCESPAEQQSASHFSIGLVDDYGSVLAIAGYDGADWFDSWPTDSILSNVLSEEPALSGEWTLWYEAPRNNTHWVPRLAPARTTFKPTGFVELNPESYCFPYFALTTDIEGQHPPPEDYLCRFASIRGVATNAEPAPILAERINPKSVEGKRLIAHFQDAFDELESVEVERLVHAGRVRGERIMIGQWLEASRRRAIPVEISNGYRMHGANSTIYYLEVTRSYPPPVRDCYAKTRLRTWIRLDADARLMTLRQDIDLVTCDEKLGIKEIPIVYWGRATGMDLLTVRHYYEGLDYQILRIDSLGATGLIVSTVYAD